MLNISDGSWFEFSATWTVNGYLQLLLGNGTLNETVTSVAMVTRSVTMDSAAIVVVGGNFKGCLSNLRLSNQLLPLTKSRMLGSAGHYPLTNQTVWPKVGCHGDDVCGDAGVCLNGGTCIDDWNSRRCQCKVGYYGDACGSVDCSVVACPLAGSTIGIIVACSVVLLIVVVAGEFVLENAGECWKMLEMTWNSVKFFSPCHSLVHSLVHSLTCSFTDSLTHPPIHPLTRSLTHPLTHSLTLSLTH
jgi:hypothetical protein